jgi:hypothetical protein
MLIMLSPLPSNLKAKKRLELGNPDHLNPNGIKMLDDPLSPILPHLHQPRH